jgi:hypothetical protein
MPQHRAWLRPRPRPRRVLRALAAVLVAAGCGGVLASTLSAPGRAVPSAHVCRSSQLRLTARFYGEAGGEFMQTFTAMNTAATACSVAGWPTLRLRSPSGRLEPALSIRVVQGGPSSRPFATVVLRPGGAASFDVFGADWDALANRACPKTHGLFVVLPDVAPLPVAVAMPYCSAFYVAPIVAGPIDRHAWSVVWEKRWCRMRQFEITIGPPISEATGQHTLALRLTNRGSACALYGFPTLSFEDDAGHIPFVVRTGGDQMIAARYPMPVHVRTGGSAWVVINHYRCDRGDKRAASIVRIGLASATGWSATSVTIRSPYERVSYCGRGDPGSTITVAPFEPTLASAFRR